MLYLCIRKQQKKDMKIIDNKKDYYDYLVGTYGMDEKYVFTRMGVRFEKADVPYKDNTTTKMTINDVMERFGEIQLRIGYKVYSFVKKKGEWEFPDMVSVEKRRSRHYTKTYMETKNPFEVDDEWIARMEKNEPVVTIWFGDYSHYGYYNNKSFRIDSPILDTIPIVKKFIPAKEVWQNIYDYLASQYDKEIIDSRTDIQKLESAGFDKKTSFRKM